MRIIPFIILFTIVLACEKPDEKGRFRKDFIGKYTCEVTIDREWGTPGSPDSTTTRTEADTVTVYFGSGFDRLIVLDEEIPINSSGEYNGDHGLADPAEFDIQFSAPDSVYIDYRTTVPEGRDFWHYRGKKNQ